MTGSVNEFKRLDPNKPIRLYNAACPYCGVMFSQQVTRTKDHVVAVNFVPPGNFDGQWNLILNACKPCNHRKSQLESEVAAISMQPDAWGRHPENDAQLASEAARRSRSVKNSRTGKPVHVPDPPMVFALELVPGVTLRTSFIGAPQLSEDAAFHLAWHHVAAFFYMITFKRDTKLGRRWAGEFVPLSVVRESDWGNSLMRSFQDLVEPWEHRVHGVAASGYFGVCIRKSPDPRELWSWALEWNRTYRLIGFIGNEEAARDAAHSLVWPRKHTRQAGPNSSESFRLEERMSNAEDKLFLLPRETRQ